jgi:predicted RNase H-like HicB family nuclease
MATSLEEYKIIVDVSKGYLDTALNAHIWFYVVTGGIVSYYLTEPKKYPNYYSLIIPLLLGVALAFASFRGLRQALALRKKTKEIAIGLSLASVPPIDILRQSLLTFFILDVLIIIGLEFLYLSLSFPESLLSLFILIVLFYVAKFFRYSFFYRVIFFLYSQFKSNLEYKAMYKFLSDGTVHGEVLDFPGVMTSGKDLGETRRLLSEALTHMAKTNLSLSILLPEPNSTLTDPTAHLEEPIYLFKASAQVKVLSKRKIERVKLLEHLSSQGCKSVGEGDSNSPDVNIYKNPENEKLTTVPNQQDITEFTVEKLCKQLEIPIP